MTNLIDRAKPACPVCGNKNPYSIDCRHPAAFLQPWESKDDFDPDGRRK